MKNTLLKSLCNYGLPITLLLLCSISILYKLLGGVITYGDYSYFFPQSAAMFFYTWHDNLLGIPTMHIMAASPILGSLPFLLSKLHLSNEIASALLSISPMFALSLVTFLIIKKLSNSTLYGFFAGIFILVNNYSMEQLIVWPGAYYWNVVSLVILVHLSYLIFKYGWTLQRTVLLVLCSILAMHPFFLAMYLIYIFLFGVFYVIYTKCSRSLFPFLTTLFLVILLHANWIIPFIVNTRYQDATSCYNGNQLSVYYGYANAATYANLLNFANYPGLIPFKLHQGPLQYFFYMSVVFCLLFAIYSIVRKKNPFGLFLVFVYLLFFSLGMGPNSLITGDIWTWLFNNVSVFGFFRSFTRFYIVSIVVMFYLGGLFVADWKAQKKYKLITFLGLTLLLVISHKIFFTGNLQNTLTTSYPPKEYEELNNKYFAKEKDSYNVLTFPNLTYESYTWSRNKNGTLPSTMYFVGFIFSKPIAYNQIAYSLDKKSDIFSRVFAYRPEKVLVSGLDSDISKLNVKYILLRKDLVDIEFLGETARYKDYMYYFSNNPNYKLLEDTPNLILYKVLNPSSTISINEGYFKNINPTKYTIRLTNLKDLSNLAFMKTFNTGWKLYVSPYDEKFSCVPVADSINGVQECIANKTFFQGEELSYLAKPSVFDNTHSVELGYANKWTVDSKFIQENYSNSYYKKNADGSINVDLVLYFEPQSYFYLGIVFTSVAFIFCIGSLVFILLRNVVTNLGKSKKHV